MSHSTGSGTAAVHHARSTLSTAGVSHSHGHSMEGPQGHSTQRQPDTRAHRIWGSKGCRGDGIICHGIRLPLRRQIVLDRGEGCLCL